MAIRFPKVYPEEKEIIAPDDWNLNLAEYVDELNGRIDADNLRSTSAITKSIVKQRAFQRLISSTADSDDEPFLLNNGFVGWQALDKEGTSMPAVEFEANTDGWLICEANATWAWAGNGVLKDDVLEDDGSVSLTEDKNPFVCRTHESYKLSRANESRPPGGWMGTSQGLTGTADDGLGHGYFTGHDDAVYAKSSGGPFIRATSPALPLTDPSFVMLHGNFPQGKWEDKSVDYYAFKLRIVVDGEPVSESGWISIGNYSCGTFLCGSIPISAGYHKVSLEARAALLADIGPNDKGLGVTFGAGKVGKHTSRIGSTTFDAPTAMPVRNGDYGVDCRVKDRNLLVSYRKH